MSKLENHFEALETALIRLMDCSNEIAYAAEKVRYEIGELKEKLNASPDEKEGI
jgi:hypothetical protein